MSKIAMNIEDAARGMFASVPHESREGVFGAILGEAVAKAVEEALTVERTRVATAIGAVLRDARECNDSGLAITLRALHREILHGKDETKSGSPEEPMTIAKVIGHLRTEFEARLIPDWEDVVRDLHDLIERQTRRDANLCCYGCKQTVLKEAGLI